MAEDKIGKAEVKNVKSTRFGIEQSGNRQSGKFFWGVGEVYRIIREKGGMQ